MTHDSEACRAAHRRPKKKRSPMLWLASCAAVLAALLAALAWQPWRDTAPAARQAPPHESPPTASTGPGTRGPVLQESLMALALELSAKEAPAPATPLIVQLPPGSAQAAAGPSAGELLAPIQSASLHAAMPEDAGTPATRRSASSRRVAADTRAPRSASATPSELPARTTVKVWRAQGFPGPCDRYNPFGEALCANAP